MLRNGPSTELTEPAGPAGVEDREKPLLACFSHLRWDFVYQRPQHLLSRAAEHYRVIFFEEPIWDGSRESHLRVTEKAKNIRVAVPVMADGIAWGEQANAAQRELIDGMLAEESDGPVTFWYYTPAALAFTSHHQPEVCVFDNMDELSAFLGAPPELIALEEQLLKRSDVVFTGGRSLHEAKQHRHSNIHAFPSSIDAAHFERARYARGAEPADQASIPHPRLGFFGVVDERMDVALLAKCAELRPDWHFVIIGPVVKIDPATLPELPNIHWLGPKAYAELPDYLAGWDVGLMPFAINEATRFISPTKTPEFLAAGVPVVSTPIRDVVRPYGDEGLVEIAASAEQVVTLAEVLMSRPKADWLRAVDSFLDGMSWNATWRQMHDLIRQARQPRSGAASRDVSFPTAQQEGAIRV